MQVTCPECHRSFKVPTSALGDGRDVKCTMCLHIWFQKPVVDQGAEAAEELAFVDADETEDAVDDIALQDEPEEVAPAIDIPETLVQVDKEEHVVDMKTTIEEPKAKTQWRSAVLAFFFVLFLFSGAALLLKTSIIKAWPASVRFYQLIGVYHGNPLSVFKWENMVSEIRLDTHHVPYLFIGADLRNASEVEQKAPYVYVALTENNQVIEEKPLKVDVDTLKAGEVYHLKIGLAEYPDTAVTARLVLSETKKDADKGHKDKDAHDHDDAQKHGADKKQEDKHDTGH